MVYLHVNEEKSPEIVTIIIKERQGTRCKKIPKKIRPFAWVSWGPVAVLGSTHTHTCMRARYVPQPEPGVVLLSVMLHLQLMVASRRKETKLLNISRSRQLLILQLLHSFRSSRAPPLLLLIDCLCPKAVQLALYLGPANNCVCEGQVVLTQITSPFSAAQARTLLHSTLDHSCIHSAIRQCARSDRCHHTLITWVDHPSGSPEPH